MLYDPETSTSDNLIANGYGHRASDYHGKRAIFSVETGKVVVCMTCFEADDWMAGRSPAKETYL